MRAIAGFQDFPRLQGWNLASLSSGLGLGSSRISSGLVAYLGSGLRTWTWLSMDLIGPRGSGLETRDRLIKDRFGARGRGSSWPRALGSGSTHHGAILGSRLISIWARLGDRLDTRLSSRLGLARDSVWLGTRYGSKLGSSWLEVLLGTAQVSDRLGLGSKFGSGGSARLCSKLGSSWLEALLGTAQVSDRLKLGSRRLGFVRGPD